MGPAKKIVIVGAGPAGLEAARVSAERGHEVVIFEAADDPGGQVRLAALGPSGASELLGIVEWRLVARLEALGVALRSNVMGRAERISWPKTPDIVLIATGGLPNLRDRSRPVRGLGRLQLGYSLAGDVKPAGQVLLYDDNGAPPGMQAAEQDRQGRLGRSRSSRPSASSRPEIGGLNHVHYARKLSRTNGVRLTINTRLAGGAARGQQAWPRPWASDYTDVKEERLVDQVVIEHGTLPLDDLYFELKEESVNRGEVDYPALIEGRPQEIATNPDGAFRLFRIGDAVSSRNIHAAIYDAMRLCKDF